MKLKVHVAADQLIQWWDGYVYGKSKEVRKIDEKARYDLSMFFLESEGVLLQKKGGEVATLELPIAAPSKWKELDQFRYVECNEMSISDEQLKIYVETIMDGWTRKNFKKCVQEMHGVLEMFVDGVLDDAQWTDEGLLEFKIAPLGARISGFRGGGEYVSPIGRRHLGPAELIGPIFVPDSNSQAT
jgi:hypothetical protein